MNSLPHAVINPRNSQRGVATVEFALAGSVFFFLLLGAIEFGRLLYLWNTVQEVTRNAARQAVVTDFSIPANITAIQRSAVFRLPSEGGGHLPASPEITDAKVVIRYLNSSYAEATPKPSNPSDNIAACNDPNRVNQCIRFVEVCVSTGTTCPGQSISYRPMISLFSIGSPLSFGALTIPVSTVRMPAESLGFRPVP